MGEGLFRRAPSGLVMENKMPNFGFSAFLKLVCLNERPSRTEVRSRLRGGSGGYDFHKSLRQRAHRYLGLAQPFDVVFASVDEITRTPERRSASEGLTRLHAWRDRHPGPILGVPPATYESPVGLFKVTFTPDFGIIRGGAAVAVHVWNTGRPTLDARMVYAALSLFSAPYAEQRQPPDDLAVLSLPDMRLYRLSEAGRSATLGASLAGRVEDLIRQAQRELGLPPLPERPRPRLS